MYALSAVLNHRYGIPGVLAFEREPGGLVAVRVENIHATARIYLQGAHVSHFQPGGTKPLLWCSPRSHFVPGRAIRGGVPLCWPWFGNHPEDPEKPAHGFVRTALWQVLATSQTAEGATRLLLGLHETLESLEAWPHAFSLELEVLVGPSLQLGLHMRNSGLLPWSCTGALHSYLQVADSSRIRIEGLENIDYLDKTAGFARKTQTGPVNIAGETDRIYLAGPAACTVHDPVLGRRTVVRQRGATATVVWNPWVEKCTVMADMEPDGYRSMVCVESAMAGDSAISLQPGEEHLLQTEIALLPISMPLTP